VSGVIARTRIPNEQGLRPVHRSGPIWETKHDRKQEPDSVRNPLRIGGDSPLRRVGRAGRGTGPDRRPHQHQAQPRLDLATPPQWREKAEAVYAAFAEETSQKYLDAIQRTVSKGGYCDAGTLN